MPTTVNQYPAFDNYTDGYWAEYTSGVTSPLYPYVATASDGYWVKVSSTSATTFRFSVGINSGIPAGATSISVVMHWSINNYGPGDTSYYPFLKFGAAERYPAIYTLAEQGSFGDVSWTLATSPNTGAAWTVAEVNSLIAGIVVDGNYTGRAGCDLICAAITYTGAAPPATNSGRKVTIT